MRLLELFFTMGSPAALFLSVLAVACVAAYGISRAARSASSDERLAGMREERAAMTKLLAARSGTTIDPDVE